MRYAGRGADRGEGREGERGRGGEGERGRGGEPACYVLSCVRECVHLYSRTEEGRGVRGMRGIDKEPIEERWRAQDKRIREE